MATWMQRRLARPSSTLPREPEQEVSAVHGRVNAVLGEMQQAAMRHFNLPPGGDALAELFLTRAKKMLMSRSEEELASLTNFVSTLANALHTGEGFDELITMMRNSSTPKEGG